ncbi:mycofactocin biosynthesis glycosyltransferase MftF [Williamsia serinedens]|uniref:Mycofactocin system glycosyltransferase n=1 Tax=Williamsia serinedens TaxID=391736 RepID=A0ABT1H3W7_9NOCA|nr:mycofactocin biosynthesis glycosyltransferase MftF [Williamsia serinedens]MCP2161442.1 mycofactocin system glycosyltransferase [Williamsia serinedens]
MVDPWLIGGWPLRTVRLDQTTSRLARRDRFVVGDPASARFARTLIELGVATPIVRSGRTGIAVTVVVPVRDDAAGLDRLLRSVRDTPVIVVDDASAIPVRVDVDVHPSVTVIRLPVNRGPGAARVVGARAAGTPLVAFLDSDVVAEAGWLDHLLPHFDDPLVDIVAPRVLADTGSDGVVARYDAATSSLDRGDRLCRVAPHTAVTFVPGAAMVVRSTWATAWDEDLRIGEDVDLCWRVVAAGRAVQFVPTARVRHQHRRTGLLGVLRRRHQYGTGTCGLARRHRAAGAPIELTPLTAAVLLAATGLPWHIRAAAGVIGLATDHRHHRRLVAQTPVASAVATRVVARAAPHALRHLASLAVRVYAPVAVAVAVVSPVSRRWAAVAIAADLVLRTRDAVTPASHGAGKRAVDVVAFPVIGLLDDLAYCAGVWSGAVRARSVAGLLPTVRPRARTAQVAGAVNIPTTSRWNASRSSGPARSRSSSLTRYHSAASS